MQKLHPNHYDYGAAIPPAAEVDLATVDVSDPELWRRDLFWDRFERLRAEEPVHFCPESLWGPYWSITRYDAIFENPNAFLIERRNARQHRAFGFGIHRCVGNRLADLQLRILWEEVLQRFDRIEVLGEPARVPSPFVKGYSSMMVEIPAA